MVLQGDIAGRGEVVLRRAGRVAYAPGAAGTDGGAATQSATSNVSLSQIASLSGDVTAVLAGTGG
ncbi:hypothetical protein FOA52_011652 [Chlamydomonas sp. UWO 241]|nr:hypothetical protein FOA52_011652 [Chlamydomonas sp. UWO 241]